MLLKETKLRQLIRSVIQEADDDQDLLDFIEDFAWLPTDRPNIYVNKYNKHKFFDSKLRAAVYKNNAGKFHRTDGPAIEYLNGGKEYWVNGKHHRIDGPAIEYANGTKWYFINGKPHRADGPAFDPGGGSKAYYINGKLHRTDGPAIEYADGGKEYWVNGKRHRTDGPAIEYVNGSKEYYLNGKKLSFEKWNAEVAKLQR